MDYHPHWTLRTILPISLALVSFLIGCSDRPTTTPLPGAQVINLYYSPTLDYLRADIAPCISTLDTLAPFLHEQSTEITTLQSGDIIFTFGEAQWEEPDYFVTQIDSQNIIFIINAENPVEKITIKELKSIFSGRQSNWEADSLAGKSIKVWTYPNGSELSEWLTDIFIGSKFSGLSQKLAPNPGAMLDAVSNNETAIGYIPDAWLKIVDQKLLRNIKILEIENNADEPLPLPVLAYLKEKPSSLVQDFLLCLQDQ